MKVGRSANTIQKEGIRASRGLMHEYLQQSRQLKPDRGTHEHRAWLIHPPHRVPSCSLTVTKHRPNNPHLLTLKNRHLQLEPTILSKRKGFFFPHVFTIPMLIKEIFTLPLGKVDFLGCPKGHISRCGKAFN